MNLHDTYYMMAVVEELGRAPRFFRDRYFPTDNLLDVFGTAKVLAEVRKQGNRTAPFVIPRIGPLPVGRGGFEIWELEPAFISLSLPVTYDMLKNRQFGEAIMGGKTPAERAKLLQAKDFETLDDMISNTEEMMCAQIMLDNGATLRHVGSRPDEYEDVSVKYYEGNDNPASFTPANAWTHSTKSGETWTPGSWLEDVKTMIRFLTTHRRPATDIIVAPDVSQFLLDDGYFHAVLDNRRMELGKVEPRVLTNDATIMAEVLIDGRPMNIIEYRGVIEDDAGNQTAFLPNGSVIVTAPDVGKGLYGGVNLVKNGKWQTITGKRVPQYFATEKPPATEYALTSCPMFVPKRMNPWCSARDVLGNGETE